MRVIIQTRERTPSKQNIIIGEQNFENVDNFTYSYVPGKYIQ